MFFSLKRKLFIIVLYLFVGFFLGLFGDLIGFGFGLFIDFIGLFLDMLLGLGLVSGVLLVGFLLDLVVK